MCCNVLQRVTVLNDGFGEALQVLADKKEQLLRETDIAAHCNTLQHTAT